MHEFLATHEGRCVLGTYQGNAAAVGYSSRSQSCRAFRTAFGVHPSDYRSARRSRTDARHDAELHTVEPAQGANLERVMLNRLDRNDPNPA